MERLWHLLGLLCLQLRGGVLRFVALSGGLEAVEDEAQPGSEADEEGCHGGE